MSELQKYLKPKEVAEKLAIALSTIYAWGKNGRLPAVKMGRCMRFSERAIADYQKTVEAEGYGKAA